MKILINEKLSQHKYKTPEGYLICVDSILARTGKQSYKRCEVFRDNDESMIDIDRTPEEVFAPATLASFENKPITVEHPDEDVNVDNYKEYAVGFVRDVKRGEVNGQDVILGTLVITDGQTIQEIENGEHTELSCGYDCDIIDEENPQQRNIRGNHVALCEQGRAGIAKIVDSIHNSKWKPVMFKSDDFKDIDSFYYWSDEWKKGRTLEGFALKRWADKLYDYLDDFKREYIKKEVRDILADIKVNDSVNDKMSSSELNKLKQALSKISHSTRGVDKDIIDVLKEIESYTGGYWSWNSFERESIKGWDKMNDGMYRKDYTFSYKMSGDKVYILISLYTRGSDDDWRVNEVNSYVTNIEHIHDAIDNHLKDKIKEQIIHQGVTTIKQLRQKLTEEKELNQLSNKEIKKIVRELGLTIKDELGTERMEEELKENAEKLEDADKEALKKKLAELEAKWDYADDHNNEYEKVQLNKEMEAIRKQLEDSADAEFDVMLKKIGFEIESKREEGNKRIHYQVKVIGQDFDEYDLKYYATKLDRLCSAFNKNHATYNIGLGYDGSITAGIDLRNVIKDSVINKITNIVKAIENKEK